MPEPTAADLIVLANFIEANVDHIAIRVCVNGKWKSLFLSEMPARLAVEHAMGFIRQGKVAALVQPFFED